MPRSTKVDANQVIGTLRHPDDTVADDAYFLAMLGRVWAMGGQFDWDQIWGEARRHRVPLPTYPFQRALFHRTRQRATRPPSNG